MSFFDYRLDIVTLLEGDRKVDRPIHKPEFFKKMKRVSLQKAYDLFRSKLQSYMYEKEI